MDSYYSFEVYEVNRVKNEDIKPKLRVVYYMIDEHVREILEKGRDSLTHDLNKFMLAYKKDIHSELKGMKKELGLMRESIRELQKSKTKNKALK